MKSDCVECDGQEGGCRYCREEPPERICVACKSGDIDSGTCDECGEVYWLEVDEVSKETLRHLGVSL